METPSPDDLTGRLLGARYRIERPLKRGGMGQVYAAVDEQDANKRVAVKVVRTALLEDPQAIARFKREARLVTELVHDNIVASLAAGDDGGLLWIAMELLEGESLRERLDARGRMSWQDTLPIVEQIVKALRVAHDKGVIHRDLKPENVMLVGPVGGERAKLLDFGVAKQAHVEGETNGTSNMTGTGLIVGTPGYVAPEVVLEGRTDDPRSDFYALGVTWFEMLTAQKPFTAKTAFALAMRHAHEPAPTPTSLVPYSPVPHPIERLVLRLMAKNPDERPQNANALLDTLKNLAEESQRALANPTPPPLSLDPQQATMTSTDLRGSTPHHTDVVPFRTPLSIQQPVAPSMTPPTTLQPVPGAATPMPQQGTQQGTPLPADFAAQVLAAIPKKKVAVVVAAVGILGVLVVVSLALVLANVLQHGKGTVVSAADRPMKPETTVETKIDAQNTDVKVAIVEPEPVQPPSAEPAVEKKVDEKKPVVVAEHKSEAKHKEPEKAAADAKQADAMPVDAKAHVALKADDPIAQKDMFVLVDGAKMGLPQGSLELSAKAHVFEFWDHDQLVGKQSLTLAPHQKMFVTPTHAEQVSN